MFILLCISKVTCLSALFIIDFALYFMPICIFLISNIITTLIWYFPSIYQLYSFIFTEKVIDLRIRIYLLLFSPLIIVLYIPICVIVFIGYSTFFILIYRLIIAFIRPEYPLYSLSLTAALFHIIYKYYHESLSIGELLNYSLIFEVYKQKVEFTRNFWNFNSIKISKKIQYYYKIFIIKWIILKLITFIDLNVIFLIYLLIIIPYVTIMKLISTIYCWFGIPYIFTYEAFNEFFNNLESISSKIKCFTLSIFIPFHYLFIFILCLICSSFIGICWTIERLVKIFFSIIKSFNNYGFYFIMDYYWIIIIRLILDLFWHFGLKLDGLIYALFGIDIYNYKKHVSEKVDCIIMLYDYWHNMNLNYHKKYDV
jgi:hypothetical protein